MNWILSDKPHPSLPPAVPVIALAPGAGLGHLVRTTAICLELKANGIRSLILSTSPFARGLSEITGVDILSTHPCHWKRWCLNIVFQHAPSVVIQDTFPFGFRGESFSDLPHTTSLVYLARRLKLSPYFEMVNDDRAKHLLHRTTTLITEPLSASHQALIDASPGRAIPLKGRIRFPVSDSLTPEIPKRLKSKLNTPDLHLVVHSGPAHEVHELLKHANGSSNGNLAVINPVLAAAGKQDCFDFFPAAALYRYAHRIYSGAGYNSVAEAERSPDKHVLMPFERRYDDQHSRLKTLNAFSSDGNDEAATHIMALL